MKLRHHKHTTNIRHSFSSTWLYCRLRLFIYLGIFLSLSLGYSTPLISSRSLTPTIYPDTPTTNWFTPNLGFGTGSYEISLGTHSWFDHIVGRNLRARISVNLWPGIRGHMQWRSNRDAEGVHRFDPFLDEGILESLAFFNNKHFSYARSLKLGRLRYLRFPTPDIISLFDLPPGAEDLFHDQPSWFQGLAFTQDFTIPFGFGYHHTILRWLDPQRQGFAVPEHYLFYRGRFKWLEWEARIGQLQHRRKPYWRGSKGYALYSGVRLGDYRIGFLYEWIKNDATRTGILVEFEPSFLTRIAGKYGLDYTRNPQGVGIQIPIASGHFGYLTEAPSGMVAVGCVETERTITYFENGQGRNFYEHIISYSGLTDSQKAHVVIHESPWYLRVESLVSGHTRFREWNDFVEWERRRQGPAQLAQRVTYTYYRLPARQTR